jgi:hypothetical protein
MLEEQLHDWNSNLQLEDKQTCKQLWCPSQRDNRLARLVVTLKQGLRNVFVMAALLCTRVHRSPREPSLDNTLCTPCSLRLLRLAALNRVTVVALSVRLSDMHCY